MIEIADLALQLQLPGGGLALMFKDGSTEVIDSDAVQMQAGQLQVLAGDSTTLETTYTDTRGRQHTVRTDCKRYTSDAACAQAHAQATAALEVLFPPRP